MKKTLICGLIVSFGLTACSPNDQYEGYRKK